MCTSLKASVQLMTILLIYGLLQTLKKKNHKQIPEKVQENLRHHNHSNWFSSSVRSFCLKYWLLQPGTHKTASHQVIVQGCLEAHIVICESMEAGSGCLRQLSVSIMGGPGCQEHSTFSLLLTHPPQVLSSRCDGVDSYLCATPAKFTQGTGQVHQHTP